MKKINWMTFLQNLSTAFLTPLSLIASASLVMGIASFFTSADLIAVLPFLENSLIQYVFKIFLKVGSLVVSNFAALYAVSLPFALVEQEKGYAAFGGFVGYLAFLTGMGMLVENFPAMAEQFPGNGLTTVLGISTVNAGMLGGILVGILTSLLHKKFRNVKFPMAFSFFEGVRFVPIISVFTFIILGNLFPFLWVYISKGINGLATLLNQLGVFGLWLFGFVERLLIPTGLHQIWLSVVRDTAVSGVYEFASGVVEGQRLAFVQYLAEGAPLNTSLREMVRFSFGPQIPIMLGALPGIGIAIYSCADKDKKKMVKPLIMAGIATAMIAGISEPLEFIFLFTAPVLYLIYAALYGLSWVFMYLFGSQLGHGSGIIEFVIFGLLRSDSRWWICAIMIVAQFVANFVIFRWFILRFDVKTPGRGGDYDASMEVLESQTDGISPEEMNITDPKTLKALTIIKGLGGKKNIVEVDSCMSRLRVVVKNRRLVDEAVLMKTGCSTVKMLDQHSVQMIYGTMVGVIRESVKEQLKQ